MRNHILRRFLLVWACTAPLVTACSASREFAYDIQAANYGTKGVVIRTLSHVDSKRVEVNGETIPVIQAVYPTLPTVPPTVDVPMFQGFERKLPREAKITWQLAALTECGRVNTSPRYPGHANKLDCTWTLLEDQIYHQQLDMAAIRASQAYKRTGQPVPDSASKYYTFVIELIFHGDQLQVRAHNGTTLGLGQ